MKILKLNKLKEWWQKRSFTCEDCKTRVKLGLKDITPYSDRDGTGIKYTCPSCQTENWINEP